MHIYAIDEVVSIKFLSLSSWTVNRRKYMHDV